MQAATTIGSFGREWTVKGKQEDWAATVEAARQNNGTINATTIDGDHFSVAAQAVAWVDESKQTQRAKIGFA